jgi:MFS family permease
MRAISDGRFSAAFEVPGFVWLWSASLLSWMAWILQSLAQGWLVLQLTNSAFWVGAAVGIRGVSQVVLAIPGGALADRLDRRTLVLASQGLSAAVAITMTALVLTDGIRLWHLLAFMALNGLVGALERPAINGLLYDVVGATRLLNASAFRFLGSSAIQIASALLGGTLLSLLGAGQNFLAASLAYVAGALCVARVTRSAPRARFSESFAETIRGGLRYMRQAPSLRHLLLLSVAIEGFGFAYLSMLPVMARDVLQIGGLGYALLWATAGVGQFIAAVAATFRGYPNNKARTMAAAAVAFGVCIVGFGLARWLPLSFVLVAAIHVMGTTYDVTIYTVLPLVANDAMRGRVLGLYASTLGLNQLGGLAVGTAAALIGGPGAIVAAGAITMVCAVALFPGARRIDDMIQAGDHA